MLEGFSVEEKGVEDLRLKRETVGLWRRGTTLPIIWSWDMRLFCGATYGQLQKMKKSGGCLGWSVVVAIEETEGEEEATEGKASGGEAGRRLLRLNRRRKDRFAVGTMTVSLWGEIGEGRSREGDGGRDRPTLVVRQTKDRQLWRGRLALVSKG